MGSQQILLLVLGVIVVVIAITVGLTMFQANEKQANIDNLMADLQIFASFAFQYYHRPFEMGGGNQSFIGFKNFFDELPEGIRSSINGTYTCESGDITAYKIRIKGVSKRHPDTIRWIVADENGSMFIHLNEPSIN